MTFYSIDADQKRRLQALAEGACLDGCASTAHDFCTLKDDPGDGNAKDAIDVPADGRDHLIETIRVADRVETRVDGRAVLSRPLREGEGRFYRECGHPYA